MSVTTDVLFCCTGLYGVRRGGCRPERRRLTQMPYNSEGSEGPVETGDDFVAAEDVPR